MEEYEWWYPIQIVESTKYPFSMGQLRNFLKKRHKNKLEKAVRKTGKRLVIRMDLFEAWINEQSSPQR